VPSSTTPNESLPPIRDDVRTIAWWLTVGFVVGGIVGGIVGGVGGRAVMLALRLASDAGGLVSDDGFTIGQLTLFDSLQLYAGMALAGALNGVAYVAARRLLPTRGRTLLWGLLGAAIVGSQVVKTDGVDFNVLEPRWFAIAGFVALPGLAALAIAWAIERSAQVEPWSCSPWFALLLVPALPGLLAAPLVLLGAGLTLALGRIVALRRLPGRALPQLLALAFVAIVILAGSADLARDAAELL
jgi:hypothetical protein